MSVLPAPPRRWTPDATSTAIQAAAMLLANAGWILMFALGDQIGGRPGPVASAGVLTVVALALVGRALGDRRRAGPAAMTAAADGAPTGVADVDRRALRFLKQSKDGLWGAFVISAVWTAAAAYFAALFPGASLWPLAATVPAAAIAAWRIHVVRPGERAARFRLRMHGF